jgi:hypothetical protein
MQPNTVYGASTSGARSLRKLMIGAGVLVLAAIIAWSLYNALTFHVSRTDPDTGDIGASSAFIDIYFSKPVTTNGLKISYSEPFVVSRHVSGKKIRLDLLSAGLVVGKKYTITLGTVNSTGGKMIQNKVLRFTAKNIPVDKMSKEQQQALINRQDTYPYSVQYVNYQNFDNLLSRGLSANQLQAVKQYIFDFSDRVRKQFWTVTLAQPSLVVQRHDAEAASLDDIFNFQVQLGKSVYQATVTSDPINDVVFLQLHDSNGAIIYDSTSGHD